VSVCFVVLVMFLQFLSYRNNRTPLEHIRDIIEKDAIEQSTVDTTCTNAEDIELGREKDLLFDNK
jgi:hypothetical protein